MVYSLEDIQWGGSGIEKVVFDFIRERIPEGATVVELGAGHVSTKALSIFYELYSVEHNPEFVGLYKGVNYIYAPTVNGWYDREVLKKNLPENYDLVLVDGTSRHLIIENMDLFNHSALFIVHDTYRKEEQETAIRLSKDLKRKVRFHTEGDYWASI